MLSRFSHVPLFVTPWTVAHQAPLSMGILQAYPPPGDLPDPGTELAFLGSPALAGEFFTTSATWEAPWTKNIPQFLIIFFFVTGGGEETFSRIMIQLSFHAIIVPPANTNAVWFG